MKKRGHGQSALLAAPDLMRRTISKHPASLRERLRNATQNQHTNLERHMDLHRPYWSQESYRHLLERFLGIYRPLEALLAAVDWAGSGIEFVARCKTDWLLADLAHFGMPAEAIEGLEICGELPRLDGIAAGLGALYVLEGATLGGQVMLRNISPHIGLSRGAGDRFFASYGSEVGAMWRSYLAVLEEQAGRSDAETAITLSAVETFSAFERWFADIGTAARSREPASLTNV